MAVTKTGKVRPEGSRTTRTSGKELVQRTASKSLCGPVPTLGLLLYLPVCKRIFVPTVRTFPSTLLGVGIRLVEHADDEVALQAHRRLAIDPFAFNNFGHFSGILMFRRAIYCSTRRLFFRR